MPVIARHRLQTRVLFGQYEQLMMEMKIANHTSFKNVLLLEPQMFYELLERVGPCIQRQDTFWRKALHPGLKLACTLRFLATDCAYKSLMYNFRVAHNTLAMFIPEVCEAIIAEYADEVLAIPTTIQGWLDIADIFSRRWNFHHCLGATDGKHIAIRCPSRGRSTYYN
ncbi:uncharacterized protein LOC121370102 [Gigantopelta aegis]|uniref:uncharacterized protein LOC121370102 n=1 Tax=Gigantopelta aegis TaxID=1735272 RepID=UPI001B88CC02|nr:uncharacterized protein LOC121370102 [Gigantopelta aegis]